MYFDQNAYEYSTALRFIGFVKMKISVSALVIISSVAYAFRRKVMTLQ